MNAAKKRRWFFIFTGAVIVLAGLGAARFWVFDTIPADAPTFPHAHMDIVQADGKKFPFDIEVASTARQLEYGFMHRHSIPANAGMLFLYKPDDVVEMWMKETPLPLDILFIRADGTIEKIVTQAVPYDVTPLSSGEPVRAALELNAGTVARLGLRTGDKIEFPGFSGP